MIVVLYVFHVRQCFERINMVHVDPGFERIRFATVFPKIWYFPSPRRPSPLICINYYLAIKTGGNVIE